MGPRASEHSSSVGEGITGSLLPLFSLDPAVRGAPWKVSELSLDERYAVCRSVGEECIQDAELRTLLDAKPHPICYDGFEPSGHASS